MTHMGLACFCAQHAIPINVSLSLSAEYSRSVSISLSLFSDTPNEFKQSEKSTAVCQHIHGEGRNWHKTSAKGRGMRNCHDKKRKRQSKRTKINQVDRAAMSYSMPGSKFMPTSLKSIGWCVMYREKSLNTRECEDKEYKWAYTNSIKRIQRTMKYSWLNMTFQPQDSLNLNASQHCRVCLDTPTLASTAKYTHRPLY